MFTNLKDWCNVKVNHFRFVKRDGAGDKVLEQPKELYVYPVSEVALVKNKHGVEVVSSSHLYVDGFVALDELDEISFEGTQREVMAIHTFYRDGKPDIKVVYI